MHSKGTLSLIAKHFGLAKHPFGQRPDTRVFCKQLQHQQAYEAIVRATEGPFTKIALSAPEGAGKTLFLNILHKSFAKSVNTAPPLFVANSGASNDFLLSSLSAQLGIFPGSIVSRGSLLDTICHAILNRRGRNIILVDDLDLMPEESLATLKLLVELGGDSGRHLHLIYSEKKGYLLDADPLDAFFNPSLATSLQYLDPHGTDHYVTFRLRKAGYSGTGAFEPEAIALLASTTGGNPRFINTLANKALFIAAGSGDFGISADHINRAIRKYDSEAPMW
jgi:type II secretory pathway predicted ATPase ExeA